MINMINIKVLTVMAIETPIKKKKNNDPKNVL